MRLRRIEVTKLFGIFNHSINLSVRGGITILLGENGLGKTVILESINALFQKDFAYFRNVEFETFTFYFDSGEKWTIDRKLSDDKRLGLYVSRFHDQENHSHQPHKFIEFRMMGGERAIRSIRNDRVEAIYANPDFVMSRQEYEEEFMRNPERFVEMYSKKFIKPKEYRSIPPWFDAELNRMHVKLIETQRIVSARERDGSYVNSVQKFSKDLSKKISDVVNESARVSANLDASYPNRLMGKLTQKAESSSEDLNNALSLLDERRNSLLEAGILENSSSQEAFSIDKDDPSLLHALKLYIDDSNEKLQPFDEISRKINLFKEIINKRFKHKSIGVNRKSGFYFESKLKFDDNGKREIIPSHKLSSGEQHELILFYELIFNSRIGDMILIDEPELSLHISWQNKFIEDLKDITSMNNFSIIIATHSPDIIAENWDLKVELSGVE